MINTESIPIRSEVKATMLNSQPIYSSGRRRKFPSWSIQMIEKKTRLAGPMINMSDTLVNSSALKVAKHVLGVAGIHDI